MKALYMIANILFIVTFFTNQFATQDAPNEEELDPDTDDDGLSTTDSEPSPRSNLTHIKEDGYQKATSQLFPQVCLSNVPNQ